MALLTLPALAHLWTSPSLACDCRAPDSPGNELQQSDAVFLGEVVSEKKVGSSWGTTDYSFAIEKSWKGLTGKEAIVRTKTDMGCSFGRFQTGERYLVYASGEAMFRVSSCSRTVRAERIAVEMMLLDASVEEGSEERMFAEMPLLIAEHSDPAVRAEAIGLLARHGPPPVRKAAYPVFLAALKDASPEVRASAAAAARGFSFRNWAELGRALLPLLDDDDAHTRRMAGSSLQLFCPSIRKECVPAIARALKNENASFTSGPTPSPEEEKVVRALVGVVMQHGGNEAKRDVLPWLLRDLKHPESLPRFNAVHHLSDNAFDRDRVGPYLLKALDDEDWMVKDAAIVALGRQGVAEAAPALLEFVKGNRRASRVKAAAALRHIGTPEAEAHFLKSGLPALINDVKKGDTEAARLLGGIGAEAAEAVPALTAMLDDVRAHWKARAAADALSKMGVAAEPALDSLVRALRSEDSTVRDYAAQALGNLGAKIQEVIPPLAATLTDKDLSVRFASTRALVKIGTPQALSALRERHLPVLMEELQAPERESRIDAARLLAETGPAGQAAVPKLIVCLGDEDPEVRRYAAKALTAIGVPTAEAVPPLLAMLKGSKAERFSATRALGLMGEMASQAVPLLIELLRDPDDATRHHAAKVLRQIGTRDALAAFDGHVEVALPKLLEELRSKDQFVRGEAARNLVHLAPATSAVLEELISALEDEYWLVRTKAAEALGALGGVAREALPALRKALHDRHRYVRMAAAAALDQIVEGTS